MNLAKLTQSLAGEVGRRNLGNRNASKIRLTNSVISILKIRLLASAAAILLLWPCVAEEFSVGIGRIDVTPDYPILLGGYAVRDTPSEGVEQRLWAKALAIENADAKPVILITLDNNGIAEQTYRSLLERLNKSGGITQDRLTIACSHTHTGPLTTGKSPNLFVKPIPPEQQEVIDRYTRDLLDKLEKVAQAALKDLKPAKLSWAQGKVSFAINRRTAPGRPAPVDHSLPVLRVSDPKGNLTALLVTYSCHCTVLGGQFKKFSGDWAGYAQEAVEQDHPGVTCLISIGCGADANPHPREGGEAGLPFAKQHGRTIAREVNRLLSADFSPVKGPLRTRAKSIQLPFAPHFTREQWAGRAKKPGIVGYHAQKYLARLDRGEPLPKSIYYPMVAWSFGNDLAFVFLPGEVVVDYALRLRTLFDPQRIWITAYANYVPSYVPSRRILEEGGYEAEDSLFYHDWPGRLDPVVEDMIFGTAEELLPRAFKSSAH